MAENDENISVFEEIDQEQLIRSQVEEVVSKVMALSDAEYNTLKLDKGIRAEFDSARGLESHKAKRRETRMVVRAILDRQFDDVRDDFLKLGANKISKELRYSEIENLRDKIVLGDKEAIEFCMSSYDGCERQHLRNLQRNAQKEKTEAGKSRIGRIIFLYLKELYDR